jgi:hypothetical protein
VKVANEWSRATPVFDDPNLVSCAGLVPVMALAESAGLSELIATKVDLGATRVKSAGVNPAGKLTSIIAGMAAGADSIDDLEVIRSGGMPRLFGGVYAASTLGLFLREFTHGHCAQLASVAREHLCALIGEHDVLPGLADRALIDIDSLLRPVYGRAKQGASFGFTKIAGRVVLRRGLSPLVTTLSTATGTPVVTGLRLRAGRTGSGKGAASMVTEAVRTARAAGATGTILVRGDAAYGVGPVASACLTAGVQFSLVLTRNRRVDSAIGAINHDAWTPVHYPGAVLDPDTGELISDAEVAETTYTAFSSTGQPVTARLIVRRVRDRAQSEELFPVWRHHPFLTNNDEPAPQADITHRQHAVIETVFADLIDGPLAHLPSGNFAANHAWALCSVIAHNLLRAAGTLTGNRHATARGATLRRELINVPARTARPQRRAVLHLPEHWPHSGPGSDYGNKSSGQSHPRP